MMIEAAQTTANSVTNVFVFMTLSDWINNAQMSRMKASASLCLAIVVSALASPAAIGAEDTELRDLDVAGWDCANQSEGTAQSEDTIERNRLKNRWPVDLSLFTVEPLDTSGFLKKVREYDSRIQAKRRGELTAAQKDQLDSYETQIVSLTGWLVPGRTIWIADAHRGDGKRFVVHADEKLTAFVELEAAIRSINGHDRAAVPV
jgi:hypothetical protein